MPDSHICPPSSVPVMPGEPDGILVVDKPAGWTSHDVVARIRRLYGTKKVGHTGTLDPMATGVLIVLIGRAAKACEYVSHDRKSYVATLRLGMTTDTEDTTGQILSRSPVTGLPTEQDVLSVLSRFRGDIRQIPPMYSALKVHGRKLCDMARAGESADREARTVHIFSLEAETAGLSTEVGLPAEAGIPTEGGRFRKAGLLPEAGHLPEAGLLPEAGHPSDYTLTVSCSGGTYIRTLCADIGQALGVGGCMASLRRTSAGNITIEESHTLDELDSMTGEERLSCLLPTESLFRELDRLILPPFYDTLCRNGCEIYQSKIGTHWEVGTRLRLCHPDGVFFALGEVQAFESGSAVKMVKLFVL